MCDCPNGYECPKCMEDKPAPHKHAALIKAWAEGAEIERKAQFSNGTSEKWISCKTPHWWDDYVYRIKPEPTPDVTQYVCIKSSERWCSPRIHCHSEHNWNDGTGIQYTSFANAKFTFDGETSKLKAVELI